MVCFHIYIYIYGIYIYVHIMHIKGLYRCIKCSLHIDIKVSIYKGSIRGFIYIRVTYKRFYIYKGYIYIYTYTYNVSRTEILF